MICAIYCWSFARVPSWTQFHNVYFSSHRPRKRATTIVARLTNLTTLTTIWKHPKRRPNGIINSCCRQLNSCFKFSIFLRKSMSCFNPSWSIMKSLISSLYISSLSSNYQISIFYPRFVIHVNLLFIMLFVVSY